MSYQKTIKSEKRALHVSSSITMRERTPPNKGVDQKFTNFVFDHSQQMAIKPSRMLNAGLVRGLADSDTTMNRSGRAAHALDAVVGGSPDMKGVPRPRTTKPKRERY